MVQAPMLDGADEHDRFALCDMRVGFCKFDAQAQQLQPQRGVLNLAHQIRQRAFVHWVADDNYLDRSATTMVSG